MSKILRFSFAAFLVFTISAIAFGQSTTTGAIGGLVTNPNKEVIPGAANQGVNCTTNDAWGHGWLVPDRTVAKDDAFDGVIIGDGGPTVKDRVSKIILDGELRWALVNSEDQIIALAIERHGVRADIRVEQDSIRIAWRGVPIAQNIGTGTAPKVIGIVP